MGVEGGPKIPTDNLIFCFDAGNTKSYSGNGTNMYNLTHDGHDGILSNEAIGTDAAGVFDFGGSTTYRIDLDNTRDFDPTTNDFSWLAWLKFGSYTGTNDYRSIYFANAQGGLDGFGVALDNDSDLMRLEINGSAGGRQTNYYNVSSYYNTWTMFTFTADISTNTRYTYANATNKDTDIITAWTSIDSTETLRIGMYRTSSWDYDGQIGLMAMWHTLLTDDQINNIYQKTRGRYGV